MVEASKGASLIMTLTPILIAIIGVSGTWYNGYLNQKKEKEKNDIVRLKLEAEKKKLEMELGSVHKDNTLLDKIGFNISLFAANEINSCIDYIFNHTKTDRFLILLACNGKFPPQYVTANFERHKVGEFLILSIGANSKYVRFDPDSSYRNMLKMIEQNGIVECDIETMPQGDYKEIMASEKLSHSNVYFLRRKTIDDDNDLLAYCSCATHDKLAFTEEEKLAIRLQISKIKNILKEI